MGKVKKAPEAMARMSYLYQASNLMMKSASKNNSSSSNAKSAFARRILSTYLSHLMVGIGQKSVTRASPEVKRSVCKGCHTILIPGDTAKVGVRSRKGGKKTEIRCEQCGTMKAFPMSNVKKIKNKDS